MPTSIAIALAPSNNRSRWRSRKAIRPLWTRIPSQTPSPSMKPLSKTETTASARGLSSPLTLIRIDAFRASETSCIDLVMGQPLRSRGALARGACPRPQLSFRRVVAPVHQAVAPPRRVDVLGTLRLMSVHIADDLAHMRIIFVSEAVAELAQNR